MEKIILKAKITGYMDGKKLPGKYRMAMEQRHGKWVIYPEQSFNGKFDEYSSLPAWSLSTLAESLIHDGPDELYIDMGQGWSVRGVRDAVKEGINHI